MLENKPELLSTALEAKSALDELPLLADALFRLFQGKYSLLCIVIAVFFVSWNLLFKVSPSGLFAYHQTRKRSRFEVLEKYLSNAGENDQSCVQAIRDIYEAECFEQATGIYAERSKRGALISLYAKISDVASWRTIRAAEGFLEFDTHGNAAIKRLTIWNRLASVLHTILGKGIIGLGALAFFILPFSPGNRIFGFVEGLGVFILSLALGFVLLRETWPYESAEKIRRRLESYAGPAGSAGQAGDAAADPAVVTPSA
jgi:hypothetical protein